jgi:molybdopterin-guanine dinucleotide biosynthesis protein A
VILKNNQRIDINALVLTGGKSVRMGERKDLMRWNSKEQRLWLADLLSNFCDEVFISCRQEQVSEIENGYNTLSDTFLNMGPLSGILSALRSNREKAWLVLACDLPLIDSCTIQYLIENRNPDKIATTYESPFDGLPEPLITIWESKSYPLLLEYLGKGITCPRKVLINNDVQLLLAKQPQTLMNVNTPEEAIVARELISVKQK